MTGLEAYMRGLVDGGPTRSGHRTPAVIVEAPVNGTDENHVRTSAWQFRQILGRGVHGILLCQAELAAATRAFVELPLPAPPGAASIPRSPRPRHGCAARRAHPAGGALLGHWHPGPGIGEDRRAGLGRLGRGLMDRCDPWPLNPDGELLLGVKLESPEGIAMADEICAVPGLGFAEMGPGDLSLSLGSVKLLRDPYPPVMQAARDKVFAACERNGIAFLEGCTRRTSRPGSTKACG